MKFAIRVGADLEIPSAEENADAYAARAANWRQELARGVQFRDLAGKGVVAGGVWTIGAELTNQINNLTPRPGFLWSVMRLAVSGSGYLAGTDLFAVYAGDVSPTKLVSSRHLTTALYDKGQVVISDGETLVLTGVGTGAGSEVYVSGQAIEVPDTLRWLLS